MTNKPTYEELEQRVRDFERAESKREQTNASLREREERLELAVTGTGLGVWDWNMVNDFVYFSPQWKRMLGYEEHEIENAFAGWKRLWHPDDKDIIERAVNDHLAGKTTLYEIEHRLRHKNGSWRWILTRGDIVKDSDGKPVRWVGTNLDITERKQAEEVLRESEGFLSRVINENPFPIWIGDSKGTILQCNQALLDLLQLEEHQLVGKYNILEDPLIEHLREGIRNIFDKGETWTFEVQWQARPSVGVDSPFVVIAGVVFPVFNNKGKIVNIVATYHDITELKQAEEELTKHRDHLEKLVEMRTIELQQEIAERKQVEESLRKNEEKFRLAMEATSDGLWDWDLETGGIFFSKAFEAILSEEIVIPKYQTWESRIHPDDKQIVLSSLQEHLNGLTFSWQKEHRLRTGDGNWKWVLGRGRVVSRDAENKPLRMVGTMADISFQKEAESALRESEAQFRLFFEHLTIGVAVYEAVENGDDFIFIDMNPAGQRLNGVSINEIRGKRLTQIFPGVRDLGLFEALRDTWHTSKPLHVPLRQYKDERFSQWVENRVFKLPSGKVVAVYDDRSELMRLEEGLRQAQKMEAIATLAGGIAHDFNNMLSVIMGNISLSLAINNQDNEVYKLLSNALKGTEQAQKLTHQLLTFAKGGQPIKKIHNINKLLEESVEFILSGASSKCEFKLKNDLWAAEIDSSQINQAINNLIINANQAMPSGGIIRIITENIEIQGGNELSLIPGPYITISIEDQGIGIQSEHITNIFDPFFTTKHQGCGLGLATTYSIVKKHNGLITVNSEPGKGSVFRIYLPASIKNTDIIGINKQARHQGCGKILIMDDEELILDLAKKMFKIMGYETETASDGVQAIEIFSDAYKSKNPFDLVILDLTIPGGMGGVKTISELLKIDPNAKAIVSSGYSNDPVMAHYKDYGFCGVVPKPYTMNQLSEVLNKLFDEIK